MPRLFRPERDNCPTNSSGDPAGARPVLGRLPSPRSVGLAIGLGRAALGAAFLAAPETSVRVLGLDTATARRVSWLARMAAVRDGVLGAGTAAAVARGTGRAWLVAGAVADAADAAVLASALQQGRVRGLGTRAIVAGAAVTAALAGWAAVRTPAGRG